MDAFVFLFHVNVETLLTGGGSPLTTKHVMIFCGVLVACNIHPHLWKINIDFRFLACYGKKIGFTFPGTLIYYSGEVGERHLA